MESNTPGHTTPHSYLDGPVYFLRLSWNFLLLHWKIIVPVVILPSVISYLGSILAYTNNVTLIMAAVVIAIISFVLGIAAIPAAISTIHRLSSGTHHPTIKSEYSVGFHFFRSFLLIAVIVGFVSIGSTALFIVPGIIIGVYSCMYLFTMVVDGRRGFSALTESYALVRGRWWGVFGRSLFLGLVIVGIQIIFSGIGSLAGLPNLLGSAISTGGSVIQPPLGPYILSGILNLIMDSIVMPLSIAYVYYLYRSLKHTRSTHNVLAFKRWLVVFLIIGIITVILIPVFFVIFARTITYNTI